MSLDGYREGEPHKRTGSGIFIREDGAMREITRPEWDEKFPGREPVIALDDDESNVIYSRNITHNLGKMADAAGVYEALWRPDEHGLVKAGQLVETLTLGLEALRADPDKFAPYEPENKWGSYDGLVAFVADYLEACKSHPDALVRVSR